MCQCEGATTTTTARSASTIGSSLPEPAFQELDLVHRCLITCQVTSTASVPKRKRSRARMPKQSFSFETTRRGPDNTPPSRVKTDLRKLPVHFRMKHEADQGERQSTDAGNARQGLRSQCLAKASNIATPRTKLNDKSKRLGTDRGDMSPSKPAEREDGFIAGEVLLHDSQKPKLAELDAVDIRRELRNVLQEHGSSEEDDLCKAPSTSQAQMIVNMHGTITTFLDHSSRFEVIYEDLHTFAYYPSTDGEDGVLDETSSRTYCCLQDTMAYGVIFSYSSFYMSAQPGGDNEAATCRTRNARSQVPPLRRHHSRALTGTQQTCDAEVQTRGCEPVRIAEVKSGLQKRDVNITRPERRLNATRESRVLEVQQIRDKIRTLKQLSPPPTPVERRTAAKLGMRTSKEEQKRTGEHAPRTQASSRAPEPRPFLYPPPRHEKQSREKAAFGAISPNALASVPDTYRKSPPRHRQKFEQKTRAFPISPGWSRPTSRRRYLPLRRKAGERPRALPTPTTSQPVYPWRRSTAPRAKFDELPCSIPISQNSSKGPAASTINATDPTKDPGEDSCVYYCTKAPASAHAASKTAIASTQCRREAMGTAHRVNIPAVVSVALVITRLSNHWQR
ncbi:hypothetical protein HPB51_019309 [Rhipicephalus microplus]|uniref:Uncharacterized protein n=1 Tax=Rhipicephalus microplus TaxID=6941 RepID=A0A9J6EUQ5_RHIMP|nr:hypothetical protein HPB51_019309 [Rhipicephalus microplus]